MKKRQLEIIYSTFTQCPLFWTNLLVQFPLLHYIPSAPYTGETAAGVTATDGQFQGVQERARGRGRGWNGPETHQNEEPEPPPSRGLGQVGRGEYPPVV